MIILKTSINEINTFFIAFLNSASSKISALKCWFYYLLFILCKKCQNTLGKQAADKKTRKIKHLEKGAVNYISA
jgi:hypothetical protein